MSVEEYEKIFTEFRNNVFCRYDSNQHKAKTLWKEIKQLYTDEAAREFEIDWIHYMSNEFQYNVFDIAIVQLRLGKK